MNFHSLCVFASLFAGDQCALSSGEDGRELTVGVEEGRLWFKGDNIVWESATSAARETFDNSKRFITSSEAMWLFGTQCLRLGKELRSHRGYR